MKPLRILLALLIVTGSINSEETFGFKERGNVVVRGYKFRLVSTEEDKDRGTIGVFAFRWEGDRPVKLYGFGPPQKGRFEVRFEQFSRLREGSWQELPVFYCGTGAEVHPLKPKTDFRLLIPLWRFAKEPQEKGDKGIVKIPGDGISLLSDPFPLPVVPSKPKSNKTE
ncbi:MAG: hypothetical protein KJO21_06045 [Verrucomicrobiae bacterium]|nr:hypothetical protein [Verrucomicrobiae bacterium]NNJ43850.1 hypothetical protein [Akkermansiaceae bacterium]